MGAFLAFISYTYLLLKANSFNFCKHIFINCKTSNVALLFNTTSEVFAKFGIVSIFTQICRLSEVHIQNHQSDLEYPHSLQIDEGSHLACGQDLDPLKKTHRLG